MRILVRLPNWLGDVVMAVGFVHQLPHYFPGADVSVVIKKGLDGLLDFFPPLHHRYVFDKAHEGGPLGLWSFGRRIHRQQRFDLFFSLPDSFSAALMGFATGAQERVGYRNEGRGFLLKHTVPKPQGLHRVEEYIHLLQAFTGRPPAAINASLQHNIPPSDHLVVNINSEASSRRLPAEKAVELIAALRQSQHRPIRLIGAPAEAAFVNEVYQSLPDRSGVEVWAGRTNLSGLVEVLASARAVLSTDSGPAHLANALGTPTVVLFGAGNEANTAPYNAGKRTVLRLGQLACEPCTRNECVRYGVPQCLTRLDAAAVVAAVQQQLKRHGNL